MSAYPIRRTVEVSVEPSPTELAIAFWQLDANQQVEFFAALWRAATPYEWAMQATAIVEAIGDDQRNADRIDARCALKTLAERVEVQP